MRNNKKQLQIKQLSPNGQLLSCVNCFSGQVSVLRTNVASAIQPYMNALAGIPGPEKFAIEYDNEPYVPHKNTLIGFGERFVSSDGTVEEFLIKNNIPENLIKSLLVSFGLENSKHQPCSKLSRCEERRIRLLAAVYDTEKVLVINDPFDPISSEWRERFAELLVNFARTKQQVVIVPYLSNRPECWIDNEDIARIQVGEAIQKTIGFTNQASNIQAMINQIRDDHKQEPAKNTQVSIPPVEEPKPQEAVKIDHKEKFYGAHKTYSVKSFYLKHSNKIAASFIAFIILSLFFSYKDSKKADLLTRKTDIPVISQPETVAIDNEIPAKSNIIAPSNQIPGDQSVEPVNDIKVPVKTALVMRYPENIKSSILRAVSGNSGGTLKRELPMAEIETQKVRENKEASDFLKLLATTASNESDKPNDIYTSDTPSVSSMPDYSENEYSNQDASNEQARREQIRQKFLEAIQRAQERSQ